MPFERPTLAELIERAIADIETRLPGSDARSPGSNLGVLARVAAGVAHALYGHQAFIANQILPDTAEAEFLARHASIWGITRKPATFAGGAVAFTGVNGSVIPQGSLLQRADGREYTTDAEATIAAGTATVAVTAKTAGQGGNADAGVKLNLASPVNGVNAAAMVGLDKLTGGADEESDAALLARLLDRIQAPPHGGADFDYVKWAMGAAGVTRAWVYPQELGLGTVTVRFMMDDIYADGIPLPADVAAAQAYIDAERPVTADLTVVAPIAKPLNPTIALLDPATQAVKDAIVAEIKDLLRREAEPGATILISHIREAISIAAGEHDHQLVAPVASVTHAVGEIATMGVVTWP